MEAEGEGKFTSMSTSKIESIKVLKKCPRFSSCRRCISVTLVACFYVNVRLTIVPSLAKLANWIGNLRHQIAIIIQPYILSLGQERQPLQHLDSLVIEDQEQQKIIISFPSINLKYSEEQLALQCKNTTQKFLYTQVGIPYLPQIWVWGSPYLCRFGDGVSESTYSFDDGSLKSGSTYSHD